MNPPASAFGGIIPRDNIHARGLMLFFIKIYEKTFGSFDMC